MSVNAFIIHQLNIASSVFRFSEQIHDLDIDYVITMCGDEADQADVDDISIVRERALELVKDMMTHSSAYHISYGYLFFCSIFVCSFTSGFDYSKTVVLCDCVCFGIANFLSDLEMI